MKMIYPLFLLALAFVFFGCNESHSCIYNPDNETLHCVEKTYKTKTIGDKVWLAENLDYMVEFSFCYGDDFEKCNEFGRLYTWDAAMEYNPMNKDASNRGVCPAGWHIPTVSEFETALQTDPNSSALQFLKSGFRYYDDSYVDMGKNATFWTASEYDGARAYLVRIDDNEVKLEHFNKNIAGSLRCVKNESAQVAQKN